MTNIIYKGSSFAFSKDTTYSEAVNSLVADPLDVLLVREDQLLRELNKCVKDGAEISVIRITDADGQRTYLRGVCMMLGKAINDLFENDERYRFTVQRSVTNGLYCTFNDASVVTEETIERIKREVQKLVEQRLPIVKKQVSTAHSIELFHEKGFSDKENLLRYRLSSSTNIYELDGYADYFYGYMVDNTSRLDGFRIRKYNEGIVLLLPSDHDDSFDASDKLFEVQKETSKWGASHHVKNVGELNRYIVSGRTKELILVQEAYHEQQIAAIAKKISEDTDKRLVMIAGPSSSGKTTFSHRLSTQLCAHGKNPHPIPMDDYFVNRDKTPLDADGKPDFECLEALDIEQFNSDMTRLLAGERVELPTYNFKTGRREYNGKYKQLGPDDILVIEGIHGLNDKLSYKLPKESKFKVYISAMTQLNLDEHNRIPTTDGRLLRRIVRDARTRGTDVSHTIDMWPSVRRGETNHIFPHQETADMMFNSSLVYEFAILKIYAEPYLHSVPCTSPSYSEARRLLKFLSYFVPMTPEAIPMNSLVREFIGGSCFDV